MGFVVTPILKEQTRMPIFSLKEMIFSDAWARILPHVIDKEALVDIVWLIIPCALTSVQSKEEALKVVPRVSKSVTMLDFT